MDLSFYLSICAILISLIGLAWSIHIGRRDRGKLEATSELYNLSAEEKYGAPFLKVTAVNRGRRPVILTMLGADFRDGNSVGTSLENGALRLNENEQFVEKITASSHYIWDEESEAIDLWFEDTLGRHYKVKNAKESLKKLFGKNEKERPS